MPCLDYNLVTIVLKELFNRKEENVDANLAQMVKPRKLWELRLFHNACVRNYLHKIFWKISNLFSKNNFVNIGNKYT